VNQFLINLIEVFTLSLGIIKIDLGQQSLDPERRIEILKLLGHGTVMLHLVIPTQFDILTCYKVVNDRQFLFLLGPCAVFSGLLEVEYGKLGI
jgi:hypothetical protein